MTSEQITLIVNSLNLKKRKLNLRIDYKKRKLITIREEYFKQKNFDALLIANNVSLNDLSGKSGHLREAMRCKLQNIVYMQNQIKDIEELVELFTQDINNTKEHK